MCSEAAPGHTQVDVVTHRRLYNRYRFDEVQQIQVKGKGPMQVYNLDARHQFRSAPELDKSADKLVAATIINLADGLPLRR